MRGIGIWEEIICLQSPEVKRSHKLHLNKYSVFFCLVQSVIRSISLTARKLILPGEVCSVQLLEVTRGGGIEHVDLAAVGLQGVDVVDQFVQVLVPQVAILKLEV